MLLGARLRAIRLEQGLTREVLGERSRVSADTIKRFEHTGRATLDTLVRICLVVGVLGEVSGLFQTRGPRTLAELEVRHTRPARVRGQRSDAGRSRARKTDEPQSHGQ